MSKQTPASYADIVNLWPSDALLAEDLGVALSTIGVMRHRDKISSRHWSSLMRAAKARGIRGLSYKLLVELEESVAA